MTCQELIRTIKPKLLYTFGKLSKFFSLLLLNKIFCSTSTNIEKCVECCFGKCKQDPPSCKESSDDDTESDLNSELEATDSESSSEESESYSGDQGDW